MQTARSIDVAKARVVATRTFRSLRVRNYRLFFLGQLVSLSGTWMQTVAQSWLVLSLTHSGIDLGLTTALQFLPMLLFAPVGGLVADRLDKRRVLMLTQGAAAVLALGMWGLVAGGVVEVWMIYGLAFLLGCVSVVDMPTRQAFVVEMVGPDEVANAVGLNSALFNSARLIGPAIAGLLIASVGTAVAFLVNAVSFLAVIGGLWAMRPEELVRGESAPRRRGQVRDGLRYVWSTPTLRSTLILVTVVSTFGYNFVVVLALLARFSLHGGARLYGALSSVMALGSVAGALAAAGRARPSRRLLLGSAGIFGALTLAVAAAPGVLAVGVLLVVTGAAATLFLATANSTLQLSSTPAMRGRVMALYGLVFLGSTPVGGPVVGWMAERWGARAALAFGGATSLAAALVGMAARGVGRRQPRVSDAGEVDELAAQRPHRAA